MIDTSKAIRTRDGRKARIIATNSTHMMGPYRYPIIAEVEHPNEPGQWVRWHYMEDGRWKSNEPGNHNDLLNEMPWHRWSHELQAA